jgi:branched-chain amino acid transport system permease protein
MKPTWKRLLAPERIALAVLLVAPLVPWRALLGRDPFASVGDQVTAIFIFGILALGLNVVVGYTGLLHLGIGAFFGIGAYVTGILTVPSYPFQWGFTAALVASTVAAALAGLVLGAPTLRLRGDYLAIVTLGFGEVVKFSIRNLEEITAGTRGLNPVPPPGVPQAMAGAIDFARDYRPFYFLCLLLLIATVLALRNLEKSRLGRSWMAIREDELAATCMGINATRVKLSAFALGAALAGLAGCLYATKLTTTADPEAYNFNRSITMLCCIILGGLGSIRGTLLGVLILIGFDNVLAPWLDRLIQQSGINQGGSQLLTFTSWRLMIFGLALILMMRFRPEGLWPSRQVQQELHPSDPGGMGERSLPVTVSQK